MCVEGVEGLRVRYGGVEWRGWRVLVVNEGLVQMFVELVCCLVTAEH